MTVMEKRVETADLYVQAYSQEREYVESGKLESGESQACDRFESVMNRGAMSFTMLKELWDDYREAFADCEESERAEYQELGPKILKLLENWNGHARFIWSFWKFWQDNFGPCPHAEEVAEAYTRCFEDYEDIQAEHRMSLKALTHEQLQEAINKGIFREPPPEFYQDPPTH